MGILSGAMGGFMVALLVLLSGGAAISFYVMGEGFSLLIAMEENTRITTILLERQHRSAEQVG